MAVVVHLLLYQLADWLAMYAGWQKAHIGLMSSIWVAGGQTADMQLAAGFGPYSEVAFLHPASQTLICTDAVIQVPSTPPEVPPPPPGAVTYLCQWNPHPKSHLCSVAVTAN